jgi:hypothetical protein
MEEMAWLRLSGGLFGSVDWTVVFAFIAIAVIYVILPVLGYPPERRGLIIASLYLLIGYAGLSLLQFGILYLQMLNRGGRGGGDAAAQSIVFAFSVLKMLAFLVAMILFVVGLQSLRFGRPPMRREPPPLDTGDDPRYQER